MLVAVKMTMIAFAAFVVETDDAPTILAKKQSILEQVRATGNGFPHVPHDNRIIWLAYPFDTRRSAISGLMKGIRSIGSSKLAAFRAFIALMIAGGSRISRTRSGAGCVRAS
ncbi:hypothetical protein AWN88_00215 [Agrobacterium tumefaciens]|nr:hypothetical protein AWN88_00215 [Agrobacterium tumefaciens]